jgi:photosystem II stability/assembly factor-like uncharacterized protein
MKKIIIKLALALTVVALSATSTLAHFGSKGPYGGGTVTSYVIQKDTIYVGTANGGVYAATWTKGAVVVNDSILSNWSAKPVGLKSGKIVSLAHTGKYAIAATADSGIFRFSGYVGSDRYWVKINKGLTDLNITSVSALDANTLIAGTNTGKIFKSIDLGANWTEVTGLTFAGKKVAGIELAGSRVFVLVEGKGVYYSDNQGANWIALNDTNTENVLGKASFSYNKSTDELMLSNASGLFVLSAAKSSITAIYNKVSTPSNGVINSISNNGGFWYVATNKGVQGSSSNQILWTELNDGLPADVNVHVVTLFKKSGIAGTENKGIFKIVNPQTLAWGDANTGFNNLKTSALATNGSPLIYVATEKGVFVTKNLATSYSRANKGLTDSLHVNDLAIFGSKVFAVTENAGVFVSADSGKVWTAFNKGLTNMAVRKLFASKGYVYVICSTGNVYETNGTADWKLIQAGLPNGSVPVSLAFLGGQVFLASHGQGAFVKPEGSGEWKDINKNLPTDHLTSITALGTNVYVSAHHGGVYVSDIHNIEWKATAETSIDHTTLLGLDGDAIQALGNYGGYVFASYKGGLLATSDEGKTWERGGNQFNLPSFTDVNKIGFAGERVFVTTENNCIWSNALSELPINVAFQEVKAAACDNKADQLSIAFTGGTIFTAPAAPYKIKWSTGDTINTTLSNLATGNYWVEITDKIGTKSRDSIVLTKEACASISELTAKTLFQVYPNPCKGNFTVATAALMNNIRIYNELGMLVKEINDVKTSCVELVTRFERGVYFVSATTELGTNVQKLIVE